MGDNKVSIRRRLQRFKTGAELRNHSATRSSPVAVSLYFTTQEV